MRETIKWFLGTIKPVAKFDKVLLSLWSQVKVYRVAKGLGSLTDFNYFIIISVLPRVLYLVE
jgi:hypothetical protein